MSEPKNEETARRKKNYLLTWYGITDLRAALGLETGGGPVLGALRTGEFTDILILAYTDPAKAGNANDEAQERWNRWLVRIPAEREALARLQELELVDAFSNTPPAHELFTVWLRSEIQKLGLFVNVRLCVKELKLLNDSKGIYDAVIRAMDIVTKESAEKQITFYLSPGTPVMAFTWAFVALANPELDIQILSSSEPRKPPTRVTLPYDLLAPSNRRQKQVSQGDSIEFDVVFHLFGEQRIAPLLGVLQFPSKRHIFVTSDQYSSAIMKQFMHAGVWSEFRVNPFDPMSTKVQILKEVSSLPKDTRIGFNLTGGTKLMFAGAIAACRKIGGVPFYFETREHSLVFLHNFSSMPVRGIDNLDMYFQANGFAVANHGRWDDNSCRQQRVELTRRLWKARHIIAKTYNRLKEYGFDNRGCAIPFHIQENIHDPQENRDVSLEMSMDETDRAYINLDGKDQTFENCPDFAAYLMGGWLEEYTYLILEPLLKQGIIRDLRIGLDVTWDALSGKQDGPIQEFDVTFTDGKRLFIIECKAGAVYAQHVYKLQQCVSEYGGVDARGIMACAFSPHSPLTRKRLESAKNLSGFYGWDITDGLADFVSAESAACIH